jgi:molybdopterin/thiamine biosynthesis adenylyltransferase
MTNRLNAIVEYISQLDDVVVTKDFVIEGLIIKGDVKIKVEGIDLDFSVEIYQQYPYQFHDTESIRFVNKNLIIYNHINRDGSICVHTHQSQDLKTKIELDFYALKCWIKKYYINKNEDIHYEHIIVPNESIEGTHYYYLFSEVDYEFTKGQFGFVNYYQLSQGFDKSEKAITNLICSFQIESMIIPCKWSDTYLKRDLSIGIFLFIGDPPVNHERFVIENWMDLEKLVDQPFMSFLYALNKRTSSKDRPLIIPLLIGYKIPSNEVHWQVIILQTGNFPNYGVKSDTHKDRYIGKFYDQKIVWGQTKNISYKYFFGRGALDKKLTESKILIIGVGALGSIIAASLVRGGCLNIDVCDYDIKEPENVCRSEYWFLTGLNNKIEEIAKVLTAISPFVNVKMSDKLMDFTKISIQDSNWIVPLKEYFDNYDIIFDCTTDNELANIFDKLDSRADIFNISLTNHAKNLVCIVKPNIYNWLCEVFRILEDDKADLYNPTGCWSPTFKASYNDISTLVQFAIKTINNGYIKDKPLRSFYLTVCENDIINIKTTQL